MLKPSFITNLLQNQKYLNIICKQQQNTFKGNVKGVRYFPKGIFLNVQLPKWQLPKCAISQAATSLMCNFPSSNFPKVRLLQWGPSAAARMGQGAERRGQNRLEAERCDQDRLGKLHWENTLGKLSLGKIPLGSCHLGKYLWESTKYRFKRHSINRDPHDHMIT